MADVHAFPATVPRLLPEARESAVFLDTQSPLRRGLIAPSVPREEKFLAAFEDRCLFYDAYWDARGTCVFLHGPRPINLANHYRAAKFVAWPSGTPLKWTRSRSHNIFMVVLRPPKSSTHIEIKIAGQTHRIAIQPNHSDWFAQKNVLFTLSKDNDLRWIEDWARFHVQEQGIDALALFDNQSTRYSLQDIRQVLGGVQGLKRILVMSVPHRYPLEDRAYPKDIFWPHFLQPSMILRMLRRFGMKARCLLNLDIDELAVKRSPDAPSICDEAVNSRSGSVYMRGRWIESVPDKSRNFYRHRHFTLAEPGHGHVFGNTVKWALTPQRRWLANPRIHPYPHDIRNRPWFTRHKSDQNYVAHFKPISTGWKYDRGVRDQQSQQGLERDEALFSAYSRMGWNEDRT